MAQPSGKSSTLWAKSGRLWNGHVYERLTSDPATVENDGSPSLLPTPMARDWKGQAGWDRDGVKSPSLPAVIMDLLPTPTAGNPNDGEDPASWEARRQRNLDKGYNGNGQGIPLAMAVQLLPTPTAADAASSGSAGYPATPTHNPSVTLTDAIVRGLGAMPPPSSDGPTPSGDQHQTPPSTAA
jgi:hypothetical protein